MATNHTTNYQLNLWEPTDRFLRTEFNENSQKIDAALKAEADARAAGDAALTQAVSGKAETSALAALSQTVSALIQPAPLLDFTLDSNTSLITVPITDEYRQKYRKLLLYFDLQANGEKEGRVYFRSTGGELASFNTVIYPRIANVADQEAFSQMILELTAPVVFFWNFSQRRHRQSTQTNATFIHFDNYCAISSLAWNQVSQLEVKPATDFSFLAGGRIQLFGLL